MEVNKKKKTYLLLIIVFVTILMGGAFLVNKIFQSDDLISIGREETTVLQSKRLLEDPLNPGEKEEVQINVKMDMERKVDIVVWFDNYSNVEKQDVFTNSIFVNLKVGDVSTEPKPMSDFNEKSPLKIVGILGRETSSFYLTFEMPSSVGNEMLNVYSEFDIHIKVEGGMNE